MNNLLRTDSANPDFIDLTARLSAFLAVVNGENDAYYAHFNKIDTIPNAVVALIDGVAVGCGAFRRLSDGVVEIKRMFVEPDLRGQGIGRAILAELEAWARELGAKTARLETSKRLESAVELYRSAGYRLIPNYDQYIGMDDSVCFERSLLSDNV